MSSKNHAGPAGRLADAIDRPTPAPAVRTNGHGTLYTQTLLRILIVALGLIWGLQVSLAKMSGETEAVSIDGLLFIHVVLIVLFAPVILGSVLTRRLGTAEILFYLASAVMVNILPLGLEIAIAPHMSAGLLTLICCMAPVLTVVFAVLLRTERVSRQRLAGIVFGIGAALVLIAPEVADGAVSPGWLTLAATLPAIAAVQAIFICRFWPASRSPLEVSAAIIAAGAAILLPLYGVLSPAPLLSLGFGSATLPLTLLALSIGLEFYLYALLIRLGGAVVASCADFVAVIAGFGWGAIFFGEALGPATILAMALGSLALWLVCRKPEGGHRSPGIERSSLLDHPRPDPGIAPRTSRRPMRGQSATVIFG